MYTRWSDCDRYGHINNVRYYDYVQESRITVTRQLLPERAERAQEALEVDPTDHIWLVARQDMDYVNQMPYRPEPFLATVAPVHLGTSSIVVATEITDPLADGRVMARARTVVVCADEHAVPTPVPAAIRATIEPNLVGLTRACHGGGADRHHPAQVRNRLSRSWTPNGHRTTPGGSGRACRPARRCASRRSHATPG